MKTYAKKRIEIQAVEYDGTKETFEQLRSLDFNTNRIKIWLKQGEPYIQTLEGNMKISKGDFVIRGVNGELYPCKPDIFHKTYDEVSEPLPRVGIFVSTGAHLVTGSVPGCRYQCIPIGRMLPNETFLQAGSRILYERTSDLIHEDAFDDLGTYAYRGSIIHILGYFDPYYSVNRLSCKIEFINGKAQPPALSHFTLTPYSEIEECFSEELGKIIRHALREGGN